MTISDILLLFFSPIGFNSSFVNGSSKLSANPVSIHLLRVVRGWKEFPWKFHNVFSLNNHLRTVTDLPMK